MTGSMALVPVTLASALTCGSILVLVSSLKQPLALRLSIPESRIEMLLWALHLVLVPLMPLAGIFIDTVGIEHGLILGSLLAAVGLSMLALRDNVATSLLTIMLIGAAASGLSVAATVLMPLAFNPERPTAAVNLGFIVFGLGGAVMPALMAGLLRGLGWRRSLLLLALLCLAPAVLASLTADFPSDQSADVPQVLGSPALWLTGLVCFFYLPVEGAVSAWASSSLTGLGFTPRQSAWLQAGFWSAFFVGRLGAAVLILGGTVPTGKEAWLLLILGLCVAVALGNLLGAGRRPGMAGFLMLAGFFLGPVYPTLLGTVLARFPEDPGTAVGGLAGLGALGSLLAAPLLAYHARQATVQSAVRIPLVGSLLLAAAALVLAIAA
jgi:fucose permease